MFRLQAFLAASDILIFFVRARIKCLATEHDHRCALFGIAAMKMKGK